ncbi:MAG: DNA repair protein RadA [Candidatus Solincola sediminis]|uniref:DNA repair protein RadA n=1 Tax=Candidatus Solincola sediminis TaxID=1797199 RepID=A0A1F2WFE3_9ACTN|nr:MAG: DNA repair protein RadA [Candidatus Solincola sediminis]OFW57876.1 MAG: DNA repair protein RadA [Candidatus Solincola sediminis]
MKATRSIYACEECGEGSAQWLGRCPACGAFGTMREERKEPARGRAASSKRAPIQMKQVGEEPLRVEVGIAELDRVLGGGGVPGSLVLIGGEPGIGKSTLLLQAAGSLTKHGFRVLMVSGEESASQIASRAKRTGTTSPELYLLCETDLEEVIERARELQPHILVIDSIQTMRFPGVDSSPGAVNQLKECAFRLQELAKEIDAVTFVVGHVTKEGALAGPRLIEHIVDCVLYFEGERFDSLRILRAAKNRFGSVSELGIFEMTDAGLREVEDPSAHFMDRRDRPVAGTSRVVVMEGRRPLVVEVQALVAPSKLPTPKRIASGIDHRRLAIEVAVLERKAKVRLGERDVYVGVSGGLKVAEPALDLGVCMAIASSHRDIALPLDTIFLGEISLTGEIRPVSRTEERLREAARLGFGSFVISSKSKPRNVPTGIRIHREPDISSSLVRFGLG